MGRVNGKAAGRMWRDAIRLAVNRETEDGRKEINDIAAALVQKAKEGDVAAMKEIGDRLDGKPQQQHEHVGEDGGPVQIAVAVKFERP